MYLKLKVIKTHSKNYIKPITKIDVYHVGFCDGVLSSGTNIKILYTTITSSNFNLSLFSSLRPILNIDYFVHSL